MRLREIIQKALEIGGRRGFITFDQLNELCDGNPKLEPVDIEALKAALNDEGINVTDSEPQTSNLSCSFCGKLQSEILQLIAGADAFICDECVQLCVRCIATEHPEWLGRASETPGRPGGQKRARLRSSQLAAMLSSSSISASGAVTPGEWLASISKWRQPGSLLARRANCPNGSAGVIRLQ